MFKKTILSLCFLSLCFSASWAAPKKEKYPTVSGNDLVSLGKFSSWEAFFLRQDNEILCWVASYPISFDKSKDKDNDAPSSYLMTSVRPMRNIRDEFSFHIPSEFAEDKKVKLSVDKRVHYQLDTQGNWAWLRSSLEEERMVISARNGNYLTALYHKDGESKQIKERFSLGGFTKAYKAALEKCAPYFQSNGETAADEAKNETSQKKSAASKAKN